MLDWLHVGDHVLQKQERPVVDPRQSRAEPPGETLGVMLIPDGTFDLLPLNPERRIGQQVVEPLTLVAVLGEGVPKLDVRGILALEHHVGSTHCVCLWVQLLAEHLQAASRVQIAQVILRHRKHAPSPARGVKHGANYSGLG